MVLWESSPDLWSMMSLFELSIGPSNKWDAYGFSPLGNQLRPPLFWSSDPKENELNVLIPAPGTCTAPFRDEDWRWLKDVDKTSWQYSTHIKPVIASFPMGDPHN